MLAFSFGQWAVYCLVSGSIAALLMNIPTYVQPVGYRPAYVAAAGLTGRDPSTVQPSVAVGVHHATGTGAALLYGVVVFVLGAVLPTALVLNGIPAVAHLVGVVVVILFIYYFFERIAMPRAGGSLQADAEQITRQWALSTFIYGVTLGLLLPVIVTQF